MKISVITVCMNSDATIETAIQSVVAQTFENIEYIVVDGKSTDGTLDIIKKYADSITSVISEPDSGIYEAMNKGIAVATGDYLFFLNSDDRFLHERVIELLVMDIHPALPDIVYGDMLICNPSNGTSAIKRQDCLNKVYVFKNTPDQPSVFYRREVFEFCGMFRTDYKIVSDFDWMLNAILRKKVTLQYLGKMITQFSTGGVSSHRHNEIHEQERTKVFAEFFPGIDRVVYGFVSRYIRSVTKIPILADILNLFIRFKLDNKIYLPQ